MNASYLLCKFPTPGYIRLIPIFWSYKTLLNPLNALSKNHSPQRMELKKYTTSTHLKSCGIHTCPKFHFLFGFLISGFHLSCHQVIRPPKYSLS